MASTASDSQVQLHRVLLVIIAVVLPVLGLVWPQREPSFDPMWARLGFTLVALSAVVASLGGRTGHLRPTLAAIGYGMTAYFLYGTSATNGSTVYGTGLVAVVLVTPVVSRTLGQVFLFLTFLVLGCVVAYLPLTDPEFARDALIPYLFAPALGLGWISVSRTQLEETLEARVDERTQALAQSNARLRQEVRERADAESRARSANRAKNTFLATMSHELRTPLNAILGYCELLTEDVEDPTARQDLGHIDTAARHLLRIVTDVLDLARIEADKLSLYIEPVELAPIVADCVAIVRPTAELAGNELHVDLRAESVRADAIRLRQVILELLQNAARFTTEGHITVRSREVDDTVEISVVDTGPGIAPAHHRRVFERFAQIDDSATRRHDGTGLGLAICQELTSACRGRSTSPAPSGKGPASPSSSPPPTPAAS